jgi:hypothetical protein
MPGQRVKYGREKYTLNFLNSLTNQEKWNLITSMISYSLCDICSWIFLAENLFLKRAADVWLLNATFTVTPLPERLKHYGKKHYLL